MYNQIKVKDRVIIILLKLTDRFFNKDLRKRIIFAFIGYSFALLSGTLLNINISKLAIKNNFFSLELILSQTSNYAIFFVALIFLSIAIYHTSHIIKEETLLLLRKTKYDESLIERIDDIVSLTNINILFDHINTNLTILEPDLDIISDLRIELNRLDSKFHHVDLEYFREKLKLSILNVDNFINQKFHTFRDDNSIMLMPDHRDKEIYMKWIKELRVNVNQAKENFTVFRTYCIEKLIK